MLQRALGALQWPALVTFQPIHFFYHTVVFWIHVDDSDEARPFAQTASKLRKNRSHRIRSERMKHVENGSQCVVKLLGPTMNNRRLRLLLKHLIKVTFSGHA